VSLIDSLLFGDSPDKKGALNLGGISNITVAGRGFAPVAYDIGPANGLMDFAIFAHTKGKLSFDEDGRIAASGKVDSKLLELLLKEPYYALTPPKSTGKELFNLDYLIRNIGPVESWSIENLLATLLELTVETVAREVERFELKTLYIAGGGSANPVLMKRLQDRLTSCSVQSMLQLGIDPRAKEGSTFALIGFLSAHGLAGQVPSCTGASGERILGSFTPGATPLHLPPPLSKRATRLKVLR
jgi:anhydro-N-acetylmuramic acid kinase